MAKSTLSFAEHKAAKSRDWQAKQRAVSQDVYEAFQEELDRGPVNLKRRRRCEKSLKAFCETYGAKAFSLKWSPNHLKAFTRIETAVRNGEMFAFAMPRGSGKTTLSRWGVLWAILSGLSPYVVLISSTQRSAERQLKNLKTSLRFNDLLFEDFPEACAPVRHLKGEARKASGQKFKGEPTLIEWSKNQIVLPVIPVKYSKCSGSIIDVTGIEGDIRGRQFERQDGVIVRPTLAVCDDPQTRDSAKSVSQSADREAVLAGDIKYMAGPDRPLGVVMPCTVICEGDMADRMLDRKRNPEWHGEKTRMVDAFPTNEKLWEEYFAIRQESFDNGGNGEEATRFYRKNRKAMDAGAKITWPQRYFPHELSAIQHAMNLKSLDEAAFFAEYQNEPLTGQTDEVEIPKAEQIAAKQLGVPQGRVPSDCPRLTAFIDISKKVLWWAVAAWQDNFTGMIVDYGVYPKQRTRHVTLQSAKVTMQMKKPGAGFEAALLAGLETLTDELLTKEWRDEAGAVHKVELCLIDAGWGPYSEDTKRFCRRSPHSNLILPSFGRGIKASQPALNDLSKKRKPGERRGLHWRVSRSREGRFVVLDTNFWKTFAFNRFTAAIGDAGCLSLPKTTTGGHRMFAEQVTAESCVRVINVATGRTVDEWSQRSDRPDNHFLDCVVGNAVAASMLGVALEGSAKVRQPAEAKPKLTLAEMRERARARR